MKDRTLPCIYYTCCNGTCQKGFKEVTLSKCKNCKKYKPRKSKKKTGIHTVQTPERQRPSR